VILACALLDMNEGGNRMINEIHIGEGTHEIGVRTHKMETVEPSAMADYLGETASIAIKDNKINLTLTITDHKTITGFQVENSAGELIEATDKQVNEEANKRDETFELDHLRSPLKVQVQYAVEHGGREIKGDEGLRLSFDEKDLA
jgi:heme-binding NEAT domain protein